MVLACSNTARTASWYVLACSSRPGCVSARGSRFLLPRQSVFDWDAATFAETLERWLAA